MILGSNYPRTSALAEILLRQYLVLLVVLVLPEHRLAEQANVYISLFAFSLSSVILIRTEQANVYVGFSAAIPGSQCDRLRCLSLWR